MRGAVGAAEVVLTRRSRSGEPPAAAPIHPTSVLTHARARLAVRFQAVAAVAFAVVGAASIHADAPPRAARLPLTFVHICPGWANRWVPCRRGTAGQLRPPPFPAGASAPSHAHPRSSGAAGATGSPGSSGRSSPRGRGRTRRGHRCSDSLDTSSPLWARGAQRVSRACLLGPQLRTPTPCFAKASGTCGTLTRSEISHTSSQRAPASAPRTRSPGETYTLPPGHWLGIPRCHC